MWFEAFNLREDSGIRFRVEQVHQWAGILRVKLPDDEDWRLVPMNKENDVIIGGKKYGDWCANSRAETHFKQVPLCEIKKELEWM